MTDGPPLDPDAAGVPDAGDPSEVETGAGPEAPDAAEPAPPSRRFWPERIGGVFFLAILLTTIAGVVVVAAHEWRTGMRMIAGALGAAGVLRLLLPERHAGMLAVRHRLLDVALLVAVGLLLYYLAGDIPDQPLG